MCKLNSTFLNIQQAKEEIQGKLQNTLRWIKVKTQHTKIYRPQQQQKDLPVNAYSKKKKERSQITNLPYHLKKPRKTTAHLSQSKRWNKSDDKKNSK